MKILICASTQKGGVAGFIETIREELKADAEYLPIGARSYNESIHKAIPRLSLDYYKFCKLLIRNKYDVVHLNPSLDFRAVVRDGLLLLIASAFRTKSVVFFHGWTKREKPWGRHSSRVFRLVYSKAKVIVVLASEFRNTLLQMGFSRPIEVITTAVDDSLFSTTLDKAIESKWASSSKKSEILFLSRIERSKGIYQVLEAVKILRSHKHSVGLVVAGEGSELEGAKAYVRCNGIGDVQFTGRVSGPLKIETFLRADVYVLPSAYEGMPVSLLEAMALGLPVITRPVGGIRDFFEDGKMGYLTQSPDPHEFALLIEKLIVNTGVRREIAIFNREYARSHFGARRVAGRLECIYREAMGST